MTVTLHAAGCFDWNEWAAALGRELQRAGDRPYYQSWLTALERLCRDKGIVDPAALAARHAAWKQAAEATPHGEPVLLR